MGGRSANCTRCPDMSEVPSQVRAGRHRRLDCGRCSLKYPVTSERVGGCWGREEGGFEPRVEVVASRFQFLPRRTTHPSVIDSPSLSLWADSVPVLRCSSPLGPRSPLLGRPVVYDPSATNRSTETHQPSLLLHEKKKLVFLQCAHDCRVITRKI